MKIKDLYKKYQALKDKEVELQGWIKNHRKQAYFGFIVHYTLKLCLFLMILPVYLGDFYHIELNEAMGNTL